MKNTNNPVSVLMVAIGGYASRYAIELMNEFSSEAIQFRGVVDPFAVDSPCFADVNERCIPVFDTIEDFYMEGNSADLAVICSPIQCHVQQTIRALQNGSHVLCDKPVAAVIQDVDELIRVRDETKKWVMIGYQWSFSRAIQSLKQDILKGLFGAPKRLKTICLWPRGDWYYNRNRWAGKIKDEHGKWVLDSPVNNAMAHFLHNLFYLIGDDISRSAEPAEVTAEVYRVNPIENYDTAACRIFTRDGIELLFYGSHSTLSQMDPVFHLEFEEAEIEFGDCAKEIVATDRKGNQKRYHSPDDCHHFKKLHEAVETIRHPKQVVCGPEAARSQVLCMNGIQELAHSIQEFPPSLIMRNEEDSGYFVKGLDEALISCYQKGLLPGEANYSWISKAGTIDLANYRYFPGGEHQQKKEFAKISNKNHSSEKL
ncbi:gfo/Idh/MocA family oxidoreductase [candidate division KSB1 bacterium]|nr:gfo/Idh/MocA family oxidoreductase [candidate division KSB1 bacterium]